MAIKRLHDNFNIDADCCVTGTFPNRESDPPGVFLGPNPEQPARGLFLTYWSAVEVAQKIGYPEPVVMETMMAELDAREQRIEELQQQLASEVGSIQLSEIKKHFTTTIKELADGQERAFRGIRDATKRTGAGTRSAAAKPTGGSGRA